MRTATVRPSRHSWAEAMSEGSAGDQYLRAHDAEYVTMTSEAWQAFKQAGGTTYPNHVRRITP